MPSEPPVLEAVEIAAFRGFRDPTRIPLGASAVVVSGPNGPGRQASLMRSSGYFSAASPGFKSRLAGASSMSSSIVGAEAARPQ